MRVGILLYTREAGRVYYGVGDVSAYSGIKINTRVAGGGVLWVLGGDECWGAVGGVVKALEECSK